ncbi:hypothetical protein DZD18_12050, partial [Rhodobacteraceae bacterium W635]
MAPARLLKCFFVAIAICLPLLLEGCNLSLGLRVGGIDFPPAAAKGCRQFFPNFRFVAGFLISQFTQERITLGIQGISFSASVIEFPCQRRQLLRETIDFAPCFSQLLCSLFGLPAALYKLTFHSPLFMGQLVSSVMRFRKRRITQPQLLLRGFQLLLRGFQLCGEVRALGLGLLQRAGQ